MKLGVYDYHSGVLLGIFLSITERMNIGQSGTTKIWYAEEDGTVSSIWPEDVLIKEIPDYGLA